MLKVVAFDCFGTVFDMTGVSREEIGEYVRHVRRNDFSPFEFPASWWKLKLHKDSSGGIARLQSAGFQCVTLSNGSADLLKHVSEAGGIQWDWIVNLAKHRVYKPHIDAYRTVETDLGIPPSETLMVTANPKFGDIEGSRALGMRSQVIRQNGYPSDVIELASRLTGEGDES